MVWLNAKRMQVHLPHSARARALHTTLRVQTPGLLHPKTPPSFDRRGPRPFERPSPRLVRPPPCGVFRSSSVLLSSLELGDTKVCEPGFPFPCCWLSLTKAVAHPPRPNPQAPTPEEPPCLQTAQFSIGAPPSSAEGKLVIFGLFLTVDFFTRLSVNSCQTLEYKGLAAQI